MANFFRSIANILTAKCNCGAKATSFPHGIPCCDECVHEVDCSCWLGYECDCSKKEPDLVPTEKKSPVESEGSDAFYSEVGKSETICSGSAKFVTPEKSIKKSIG